MGCIRVDKITEYLCDPLQRTLVVGTDALFIVLLLMPRYLCLKETSRPATVKLL
jgi:hypothetical protein